MWYLRGPSPEPFEKILPLPFVYLIVHLGQPYRVVRGGRAPRVVEGAFFVGIQDGFLVNENPRELFHVALEIRPDGLLALCEKHCGQNIVAAEQLQPGLSQLREHLAKETDPTRALDVAQTYFEGMIRPNWTPHSVVRGALRLIDERPDRSMRGLAEALRVSDKTLIGAFRRYCGISPKKYADVVRLYRFVRAIPSQGPMPAWADLAVAAGYYDQPHFIRRFAQLTGQTPRAYLTALQRSRYGDASFLSLDELPEG